MIMPLFLLLATAYFEFRIGKCQITFGASNDDQMELSMVDEYEKLATLQSSDDCWDQVGGQQNFEELMRYKQQVDDDLTERGYGELLDEIDEQVTSVEPATEEKTIWKYW